MLELRKNAESLIEEVRRGRSLVLTYRGRAVARIEPIETAAAPPDDPFYGLSELADSRPGSLNNREIDKILYGR